MRKILKAILFAIAFGVASSAIAGEVSRAMFTTSIQDREPVIAVDSINSSSFSSITFFTELNDLEGHNITHQWSYDGKVMFEKSFEVNGARWRVWTSKTLLPEWTGSWTVNVLDDDRTVLTSKTFEYQ
ncbi:MAG: DUF2914 domain-containing protein [Gammaproteobacteria bacterium]|nr:DUF2914 domain-containing protein [Gammaproteobacteria bacterium]